MSLASDGISQFYQDSFIPACQNARSVLGNLYRDWYTNPVNSVIDTYIEDKEWARTMKNIARVVPAVFAQLALYILLGPAWEITMIVIFSIGYGVKYAKSEDRVRKEMRVDFDNYMGVSSTLEAASCVALAVLGEPAWLLSGAFYTGFALWRFWAADEKDRRSLR